MGGKAERRLTNIRPKEVSHVDTAANEEDFIFVKRGGDNMNKKELELFNTIEDLKKSDTVSGTENITVASVLKSIRYGIEKMLAIAKTVELIDDKTDDTIEKSVVPSEVISEIKAINSMLAGMISEGEVETEKSEDGIEKAGKKISTARMKKLRDAQSILNELINAAEKGGESKMEDIKKDAVVVEKNEVVVEKDAVVVEKNEVVVEKDAVVVEKNEVVVEKDAVVVEKNEVVVEKDAVVVEKNEVVVEKGCDHCNPKPATEESEVLKAIKGISSSIEGFTARVVEVEKSNAAPGSKASSTENVEDADIVKSAPKSLFHNIIR